MDELNGRVVSRAGQGDDSDGFFAAVWALGLFVNSVRTREAFLGSPAAAAVREASGDAQALRDVLALVPASGIADLRRLDTLATLSLYPRLHEPDTFHPLLESSGGQAEADVIADGKLIDLKTTRETTSGKGLLVPSGQIYQVIAYAVINNFEYREAHGTVHSVGIYAARFGTLHTWPLAELLDRIASSKLKPYREAVYGIMEAIGTDGMDAQFR